MSVIVDGTNGVSGVSGSAGTPAFSDDQNSGVFFPAANTVAFSTADTERMRIDSSGNINIATAGAKITGDFSNATPANRVAFQTTTAKAITTLTALPLSTAWGSQFRFCLDPDPANTSFMQISQGSLEGRVTSGITGTGSYLPMAFHTGGSERMRIDTSGYVFINETVSLPSSTSYLTITTPASTVFGATIKDSGTTYATTTRYMNFLNSANAVAGSIQHTAATTTAYATSSDARLKENITDAPSALAVIDNISVRSYDWKDGGPHVTFGFVAQELHPYCPEAVSEGGDDVNTDPWQLEYGRLTPFLMKAIKELKEQNDSLRAEFDAYKASHP